MDLTYEHLQRENRLLRHEIKEQGDLLHAIKLMLEIYERESIAIASSDNPIKCCEKIYADVPTGVKS